MKKGMLALAVLSCVLLVGAPACRHRRDQSKHPPPHMKEQRKAAKKQKYPKKKPAKAAQSKLSTVHKK